jgi:hypothetical protein
VLFYCFDRFVSEYESWFQRHYGYFRLIVRVVVKEYPDGDNAFGMLLGTYSIFDAKKLNMIFV